MTSIDSLARAWLKRVKGKRGVTQAEWPAFINRLDGSKGECEEIIKGIGDAQLLQLWNAARQCAIELDDVEFAELRDFTWSEIGRRAQEALVDAG